MDAVFVLVLKQILPVLEVLQLHFLIFPRLSLYKMAWLFKPAK